MRSTYYPGVCTNPGTYYHAGLVYVHEVYTGTDRMRSTYYPGVCAINQVRTKQVSLYGFVDHYNIIVSKATNVHV